MLRDEGQGAVVLLSAGLDSTYNLLRAHQEFKVSLVLTFDYGQKASLRELQRARHLAQSVNLRHEVVSLPWFKIFTQTSLLSDKAVPVGADIQIDDKETSERSAERVWVPNRNGIFLNIAAGFAEGLGAQFVVPGFNLEEAQTFPDNSAAYLASLDQSFKFSTSNHIRTKCYSIALDKTQIVAEGKRLGLPFHALWPCYLSGAEWCGQCESCQRYRRALSANGLSFDELKGTKI